jgi:hypothetical protein
MIKAIIFHIGNTVIDFTAMKLKAPFSYLYPAQMEKRFILLDPYTTAYAISRTRLVQAL